MGDFRIVIDAVGGHGQDRDKKDGEVVDFSIHGENAPEALAKRFVDELKANGCSVDSAKVIHWPLDNYGGPEKNGRAKEIVDDLLTGVRSGNF
ncbi:MAG: hypothetical protein H7Y42_12285 [Chitinophagaceae bacterium]|nr:hypothetical protein [Chitinophagaceae bacterium]